MHRTRCEAILKQNIDNQILQNEQNTKIPEFGEESIEDNEELYKKCISDFANSIYYVAKDMYYKNPKRSSVYIKNVRLHQAEIYLDGHWQIVIFNYIIPKMIFKCNTIVSSYYQRYLNENVHVINDNTQHNNAYESTNYRQKFVNDLTNSSSLNYKKTYSMIKALITTYKKPRELEV